MTTIALGGAYHPAYHAHLLKQIAQNHIIVPCHLEELFELGERILYPLGLDDDGTVAFENVDLLAVS